MSWDFSFLQDFAVITDCTMLRMHLICSDEFVLSEYCKAWKGIANEVASITGAKMHWVG